MNDDNYHLTILLKTFLRTANNIKTNWINIQEDMIKCDEYTKNVNIINIKYASIIKDFLYKIDNIIRKNDFRNNSKDMKFDIWNFLSSNKQVENDMLKSIENYAKKYHKEKIKHNRNIIENNIKNLNASVFEICMILITYKNLFQECINKNKEYC